MFLVCLGRTSVDPTDQGGAGLLFGTHFQDAWDDLVQEVIIINVKKKNIFMSACVLNSAHLNCIFMFVIGRPKRTLDKNINDTLF